MEKRRLENIEDHIFGIFRAHNTSRVLTKQIFEGTREFSNADLVRAFEDLEKRQRLVVRFTRDGYDWISLTANGMELAGIKEIDDNALPAALPHPPKSSTSFPT